MCYLRTKPKNEFIELGQKGENIENTGHVSERNQDEYK